MTYPITMYLDAEEGEVTVTEAEIHTLKSISWFSSIQHDPRFPLAAKEHIPRLIEIGLVRNEFDELDASQSGEELLQKLLKEPLKETRP